MATPSEDSGANSSLVSGPPATYAFGPREDADATRQAQHAAANDVPLDVNLNAVVCRSQALTFDGLGKSFASNQDRRDKIADYIFQKLAG